jgi:uncharacterized membrane protein YdjX (TVP38/TMEM64 family)
VLENQYFSSVAITAALAARLAAATGPEVVLIAPQRESGWLEQNTMGVLRARLQRRLRQTDAHGRFRAYCPALPGSDACLNVHSKIMLVDDELLTIGSANLSNRSMGLDTECNLVITAAGQGERAGHVRAAIAALRNRLLAEHLGTCAPQIAAATGRHGLIGAIETLRGGARTLLPSQPQLSANVDAMVPDRALIDPERPLDPDRFIAGFATSKERGGARGRAASIAAAIVLIGGLTVAWKWTPLQQYVDIDAIVNLGRQLRQQPLAPLLVPAIYVAASLVAIPITLLIAATALVFGPWSGALYAVAGSLLGAAATYGVGRGLGRDVVRRYAGQRINRLNRQLAKRGLLAVTVLRLLPIAPFTVVNMVAGAAKISPRDFLLGTFFGMAPGIAMTLLFVDRVAAVLRRPNPLSIGLLVAVATAIAAAALLIRHWLRRRHQAPTPPTRGRQPPPTR